MASGHISTMFHNNGYKLNVAWSSSTATASNSSIVTAVVTLVCYSGYSLQISSRSNTIKINGKSYSFVSPAINTSGNTVITLGTIESNAIPHNSDGSKSVNISCTFNLNATISNTYYSAITASGNVDLDNILKKATLVNATNFHDTGNPIIAYSNPAGSSATSLQACIADATGSTILVPYRDIPKTETNYTFNLTEAERKTLRDACDDANSMTVAFYIRSVINGVTYYSYLQKTFLIADTDVVISAIIKDTNSATIALTGNSNVLIKYHSNATATMTASSSAAIDLDSCVIRNGGNTGYGTSYTFNNVESNVFTFSATDSRNNTGTSTVTATMIDYVRLTCNIGNDKPDTNGNMTLTCSGNYFNSSFGSVSNTLTVQYRYKAQNGSFGAWTNMNVSKSGNTYTAVASLSGLNYQTTYVFETRATDKLATATSAESAVKSIPVFHWSESDFVFEVPVTFNAGASGVEGGTGGSTGGTTSNSVEGDFSVTGNLRLKGSGNYGNYLYFGDGSYAYIGELTDDDLTIKSSDLNLNVANLYFNNRSIKYGTWSPTLSSSAVSSYSVQQGWYQKVGGVVTIGWQIKANCNSGYNSTSISIGGLPFTPTYDASGSGVCSGAYVSAGFNFECWVVSTGGTITGRVQSCNNTTAANLSTSASGLFYRSGGGEITLGGTICYITNET